MPNVSLHLRRGRSYTGGIDGRLDEAKLDQLRAWGSGLSSHENPDVRATGKAILLLIEEIERLHIDVWHAKAASAGASSADGDEPDGDSLEPHDGMAQTLRGRLRRLRPHA